MRTSYASKPLNRRNSSTLQNRTLLRLAGLRGVLPRPFGPHVAGRRLDRDRPSQRETRQFAGGQRAWRRHVIRGGRAPHLIPTDVRGDVFVVGKSPSAQSSWRILNFSVSPSSWKSSSAAIVYGLSHVPHTMPRSLVPTFLMMKNCFGAPTPNPSHTPTTSFSVSLVFHGPGRM